MEATSQLIEEAQFLMNLQHDSIVKAYGIYRLKFKNELSMGMLLDYKSAGSLDSLTPDDGLLEGDMRKIMAQICNALVYLHEILIVHRDIKESNVLS